MLTRQCTTWVCHVLSASYCLIVPTTSPNAVTIDKRYTSRAEEHQLFIDMLKEYSRQYGVTILAYCLMPNRVHLVAVPQQRTR